MRISHLAGWRRALAGLCLGVLPALAAAQPWASQTSKDAHLRAGPAVEYPVVAVLLRGTDVTVQGCLADYRWCDVTVAGYRGWVYGGNLVLAWQGQPAPVLDVGAVFGIAILGFVLEDYWGQHYRAAPWYPQRHDWVRRVPPPVMHPRPPMPNPVPGVVMPGVRPPEVHAPRHTPPGARPPQPPASPRPPASQPPAPHQPVSEPRPPVGPGPSQGTAPPARPRGNDTPPAHRGQQTQVDRGPGPAARGVDPAVRPAPPPHTDSERHPGRPAGPGKRDSD